jgi:diguanylate cyclase (GGDEF)-like protein
MIDLDHFKALNDQFGHRAGDEVLRQLGRLLDAEKRTGDLVARYGGEEFVALLPHAEAQAAVGWAERVRQRIAATRISFEGGTLEITASFGVAGAAPDGAASDLVEAADAALFEAKRAGRNRVVSGPSNARVTGGAMSAVKT